ncbi:hypothetical protein [Arthrobacter sp. NPDC093139]|uniref:hypothetical protein n=1 Tax=Arthrobacter sp. NPDC093139 TaxID=3363945 RepID=UPI00381D5FEA
MMEDQGINPVPRSWPEKAQDLNLDVLVLIPVLTAVFQTLQDPMGFWPAVAIVALIFVVMVLLLGLLIAPIRRKRMALDAEHGVFECTHRERGSPLRRKWATGYAKAEPGRLLFQAKTGITGSLAGPLVTYTELDVVSQPTKAPWGIFPRGRVIELSTDKGTVELAASASSMDLLIKRCP